MLCHCDIVSLRHCDDDVDDDDDGDDDDNVMM